MQAEDALRLVRVEFGDVKRDAETSTVSMTEAAEKMSVRVNSIAEEVHSWDKSVDTMRAHVDRLETAFKRVQFELLNSESRGVGGLGNVGAFSSPFAAAANVVASSSAAGAGGGGGGGDDENDFRPRPFGARSQPLLRTAEAEAALAARRKQQQLAGGGDMAQEQTTDQSDNDVAEAKAAAAKRLALQEHGIKAIMAERERKEREAAAAAAEQK